MKRRTVSKGSLAGELARLPGLSREELIELWRKLYETEPPKKSSNQFLIRAIAYRMQEQIFGGLTPETKRILAKAASDAAGGRQISMPVTIKPGTKLLREWHGTTYEAIISEAGVLFQGKQYRSLSEVARAITGVRWSGPLFFGLKGKAA